MPKELIIIKNERPITTSLQVAETFEKRHDNILRDLECIKEKCSNEFWQLNFEESKHKTRGKEYPMYLMTKDGFAMLVMGFTGEKAFQFKELYIKKFNEMERFITSKLLAKMEFPQLTDNIKIMHEEPKRYHFTNEIDMINRIVLGKSSKQFKEANNIPKNESIRKYLSADEIEYIEKMQRVDIGMVIAIPDFYDRKKALQNYYNKIKKDNLRLLD